MMKEKNIDNLTSLWLVASEPFNAYTKIANMNLIHINFSDWPNRVWQDPNQERFGWGQLKAFRNRYPGGLTLTKWNSLERDGDKETEVLGLSLKSIQIGMSLDLDQYNKPSVNSNFLFHKVDCLEKAVLWSGVFQECFNYSISHEIIDKIKDKVGFYLITEKQHTLGCVVTYINNNEIGIHCLGVLDIYRKRGIAESVMHRILHNAKNSGLVYAHLQSSKLGFNIYKNIGFEEIFKMCNYSL